MSAAIQEEKTQYTAEQVKEAVLSELDKLLEPWMVGRAPNYSIDTATKHIIATGYWLDRELSKICSDEDRKTQCWKFNRMSRTYDIWDTAAECINEAINKTVEQNRVPHRRWG